MTELATGFCPVDGGHEFTYYPRKGKTRKYCSPAHASVASAKRQLLRNSELSERRCPRCDTIKPSKAFSAPSAAYCKPCMADWARDRRKKGIASTPEYTRIVNLRRYGLTPETFADKLAAQGGRCDICGTREPGGQGWHVDHDHSCCNTRKNSCGKCLRGILCTRCNIGIGNFKDDPVVILAARNYILKYRGEIYMSSISLSSRLALFSNVLSTIASLACFAIFARSSS